MTEETLNSLFKREVYFTESTIWIRTFTDSTAAFNFQRVISGIAFYGLENWIFLPFYLCKFIILFWIINWTPAKATLSSPIPCYRVNALVSDLLSCDSPVLVWTLSAASPIEKAASLLWFASRCNSLQPALKVEEAIWFSWSADLGLLSCLTPSVI